MLSILFAIVVSWLFNSRALTVNCVESVDSGCESGSSGLLTICCSGPGLSSNGGAEGVGTSLVSGSTGTSTIVGGVGGISSVGWSS